jgi:hypothetical protein
MHGEDGNITNAPALLSASHIAPTSPCRGAGTNLYSGGMDIDGEPWLDPPSMGCDEYHGPGTVTGALAVAISGPTHLVVGYEARYTARIEGRLHANRWDFDNGATVSNAAYPTHAWGAAGMYEVVLTAYNDDYPGGVSATQTVAVATVEDSTVYVKTDGDDAHDGRSWAMAKQTLQGGVDAQNALGGLVLATNGTYRLGGAVAAGTALSNRVAIAKPIRLESVR